MENLFEELNKINVSAKTEKKGNLTYLSWSWAWSEFKKKCPSATYKIKKFGGLPYVYDEKTGYMVFTSVTVEDLTHEMWLPVMDFRNKAMKENATMFDINKTMMRCLTKNLAMFGLGLYIYAGEDLPEKDSEVKTNNIGNELKVSKEKLDKAKNWGEIKKLSDELITSKDSPLLETKDYKAFAEEKSKLELNDKNTDEIISILSVLVEEKKLVK